MNTKNELDTVILLHDIPEHGLKRGDIGAIVHVYRDKRAYEVEFVEGGGRTVALVTLTERDIRPMGRNEILHARVLEAA
ncbi:MAG: DUF4926 domain-containing protein [Chloroflexi bacterium]|nr:DUF4926 domain-containing protein [Chloroflexota bacterium]